MLNVVLEVYPTAEVGCDVLLHMCMSVHMH
jgi:hypothetical protein